MTALEPITVSYKHFPATPELWPKSTIPKGLEGFYNPTPHPAVCLDITGPNGNTVNEWGMIDTGCDETAFPARLMPLLGISLGDCDVSGKPALTQEGLRPNPVYLPGLPAVVAGTFPVKLTAMFPPLFQFPWIALGREDFMAQFRVTFDQRALTTTLEPYPEVGSESCLPCEIGTSKLSACQGEWHAGGLQ